MTLTVSPQGIVFKDIEGVLEIRRLAYRPIAQVIEPQRGLQRRDPSRLLLKDAGKNLLVSSHSSQPSQAFQSGIRVVSALLRCFLDTRTADNQNLSSNTSQPHSREAKIVKKSGTNTGKLSFKAFVYTICSGSTLTPCNRVRQVRGERGHDV